MKAEETKPEVQDAIDQEVADMIQKAEEMPKNRRQRRIAQGINKKGARNFSNKKGIQLIVTKFANGREVKHERFVQRIPGKAIVHYRAA